MEEQRISRMYLNHLQARFSRIWYGMFGNGLSRSSLLPWVVVALIVVPVIGYALHVRGKFHLFKQEIKGGPPTANVPRPGGLEAMVLQRKQTAGSNEPQFLEATLLPGMGMDVLQLTAFLPGRGEVELLSAPTIEQMAAGTGADRSGADDERGAIEMPWGGSLPGVLSPLGTTLSTYWKGRTLELPVNGTSGRSVAEGGLLTADAADVSKQELADGMAAKGVFNGTTFSDRWLSKSDVAVRVELEAKTLDLYVTAKNTGNEPEPMGIGWHPRFLIPSGGREAAELLLPNGEVLEVTDKVRDLPTGKTVATPSSVARLQGHVGMIGAGGVDDSLVHLKAGAGSAGIATELRDPASGFGLRITALSASVREFRVLSPAGSQYVGLGMQTNLDDPFGRQWATEEGGGITVLQPGQAIEWRVRLEIFAVGGR